MDTGKTAIFLYETLDNNLEISDTRNLVRLQQAALGEDIEVYVYLDRGGEHKTTLTTGFDVTYHEWLDEKEHLINGAMYGKYAYDDEAGEYRIVWSAVDGSDNDKPIPTNSADTATLTNFLNWCSSQTSAEHQMFFMADHGSGVSGAFKDYHSEMSLTPLRIAEAIRASEVQLDVLVFDACLMGNAETLSCFEGIADYLVASEEVGISSKQFGSFDYCGIVSAISQEDELTPEKLAMAVLEGNKDNAQLYTLSSVRNDGTLCGILNDFGEAARNFTETDQVVLARAFLNKRYSYDDMQYSDFKEILQEVLSADISDGLKQAAQQATAALDNVIIGKITPDCYNYHGEGLTVFNPLLAKYGTPRDVSLCDFNMTPAGNDTAWSTFLFQLRDFAEEAGLLRLTEDVEGYRSVLGMYYDNNISVKDAQTGTISWIEPYMIGGIFSGGSVFRYNYKYDTVNPSWFVITTPDAENFAADMSISFEFQDQSAENADVTLGIYSLQRMDLPDNVAISYEVADKMEECSGTGNDSLTLDLSGCEPDTKYVLCLETDAPISFTIRFNSEESFSAKDYINASQNNNTSWWPAMLLSSEYFGGLAVKADTESECFTDYYSLCLDDYQYVTVVIDSISGGGEINENTLVVAELDFDDNVVRTAEYSGENHSYTLSLSATDQFLIDFSVATTGDQVVSYSIYTPFAPGYTPEVINDNCTENVSVNLAIDGKVNSYAIGWDSFRGIPVGNHTLQFCQDNGFNQVAEMTIVDQDTAKVYNLGANMEWRVRNNENWVTGKTLTVSDTTDAPKVVASCRDMMEDIFFANKQGVWSDDYLACNTDTGEQAEITGKNQFFDVFRGTRDDNVLLLTDDDNGDAFFADDIFSDSADDTALSAARFSSIKEIRAGAGDDIIDMTSLRFSADSDAITIYGGNGNDILWAAGNGSTLFGDDGDDHLTGTRGNDTIIGGSGNDILNGNGGNDLFLFCENWGQDIVCQTDNGKVTLWFASGKQSNWNPETLTYTDGDNRVVLTGGVLADNITLKFGDDGSDQYRTLATAGAFEPFATRQIFEQHDSNGMLA